MIRCLMREHFLYYNKIQLVYKLSFHPKIYEIPTLVSL
jgi:hypothetical protein